MDNGVTSPAATFSMSLSMLLRVGTRTHANGTYHSHSSLSTDTIDPRLMASTLAYNMSFPLLGVGLLTLLLSLCFCCYLWKLKRDGHSERGYSKLKYQPRSEKVKNDMCPVCLEEFERAEKLAVSPCRHGFHTKCLQQWLDQHNTCPMCKTCVTTSRQAGERTGLITSHV